MTALLANEVLLSSACTAVVAERRCVDGLRVRFHPSPGKITLSLRESHPGLDLGSRGVRCGPHAALRVGGMRHRLGCQWPHEHVERPRAAPQGYCTNCGWGRRSWERAAGWPSTPRGAMDGMDILYSFCISIKSLQLLRAVTNRSSTLLKFSFSSIEVA